MLTDKVWDTFQQEIIGCDWWRSLFRRRNFYIQVLQCGDWRQTSIKRDLPWTTFTDYQLMAMSDHFQGSVHFSLNQKFTRSSDLVIGATSCLCSNQDRKWVENNPQIFCLKNGIRAVYQSYMVYFDDNDDDDDVAKCAGKAISIIMRSNTSQRPN